jgi:mannose-6-phosphate isomerase class I
MNVTDFYSMGVSKYKPARIPGFAYRRKLLIKCEKFVMETIELGRQRITEKASAARSVVHTITSGKGKYFYGEKKKSFQPFKKGETYLIPAKIGEYDIASQGATEIVVSYVE